MHFQLFCEIGVSVLVQSSQAGVHPVEPFPGLLVGVQDDSLDLTEVANDGGLDRKTIVWESFLDPTLDGVWWEEMLVEDEVFGAFDTHLVYLFVPLIFEVVADLLIKGS